MALLERRLKQRIVGAVVLLALGVVFLPMLFNREDEVRRVRVEAPPMPPMPTAMATPDAPVAVPEPQAEAGVAPAEAVAPALEPPSSPPLVAAPAGGQATPPQPAASAPERPAARLDADGVPVSWSVQLASLSSRARAEELQRKLRAQGFDAYIRSVDGMHRVFVGPLLERTDAERVREQIARQHRLSPIVVRFQPERR
ncbi:SPOR domain-containing protein [Pseudomonas stutzeri]|nr:SPOR domain-containing protein [Stutzerimonas stutzeri]